MSYTLVSEEPQVLEDIWEERKVSVVKQVESELEHNIQALRDLVSKEENLYVPQDDEFFIKFLRGGDMDPERAMEIIRAYFTMRKDHWNYFEGFRNVEDIISSTFSQKIHGMLANRDGEGRRIYVFRPGRWNPDKIDFKNIFCAGVMLCEMVAREERTQIAGITAIVDANNFGWKQLKSISMDDCKNIAGFFNISFPVWLRRSHILNAPRFFHIFFGMVRPFLSETTRKEVVFHTGNISDSMKEYFRLDLLPKDLGGKAAAFDNAHNMKEIRECVKYFKDIDNFGYRDS